MAMTMLLMVMNMMRNWWCRRWWWVILMVMTNAMMMYDDVMMSWRKYNRIVKSSRQIAIRPIDFLVLASRTGCPLLNLTCSLVISSWGDGDRHAELRLLANCDQQELMTYMNDIRKRKQISKLFAAGRRSTSDESSWAESQEENWHWTRS